MANDTKNFKVGEFACKCGCGNEVKQELIDMLQVIRERSGIPIRVNSGYRCPIHNAKVGGVKDSQHIQGVAADISCSKGAKFLWDITRQLYNEGKIPTLQFCKLYRTWIHVDCGKKRKNVFDGGNTK